MWSGRNGADPLMFQFALAVVGQHFARPHHGQSLVCPDPQVPKAVLGQGTDAVTRKTVLNGVGVQAAVTVAAQSAHVASYP